MSELRNTLPKTAEVIERGMESGVHTGVQLCVMLGGSTVFSGGIGDASRDTPMTAETIMPWRSAGKPLTAALVARMKDRGELSFEDRVTRFLPGFAENGKADVTIEHVLTHMGGFASADTGWPHASWEESVAGILAAPLDPGAIPGRTAAYHPQSGWFVLGEIVRCICGTGTAVEQLLHTEIVRPLGMQSCWCGVPDHIVEQKAADLPEILEGNRGGMRRSELTDGPWLSRCSPGGNFRGPVSELAAFYRMMLNDGVASDGRQFLQASTVAEMTARRRTGLFDQTFQHPIDFGLGFILNSSQFQGDIVPYGYGTQRSGATFGHGGAQCAMAFCDPETGLIVAWAANGLPGEAMHQRRNRFINDAIESDLR